MKYNQSLEDALYAWAANEQKTLHLGYPSVAAGFSEYQSGYRVSSRVPSQAELDKLGLIERGIGRMYQWKDKRPLECLTEFYGAYPDAPPKAERMKAIKKTYTDRVFYQCLKTGKTYLQGIIDVYVESA